MRDWKEDVAERIVDYFILENLPPISDDECTWPGGDIKPEVQARIEGILEPHRKVVLNILREECRGRVMDVGPKERIW